MRRSVAVLALVCLLLMLGTARAQPVEHTAFERVWERSDMPVATLQATRTWMWGPEAISQLLSEPYAESPGGQRIVQYFDKSRMEINDAGGDRSSPWFVTNGLLALELVSGRMAVGDTAFELHEPARVNVAGDPDDPDGPTYATFSTLQGVAAPFAAQPNTRAVSRDGSVTQSARLAQWGAADAEWVSETRHWVAAPFWEFMNAEGLVYANGIYSTAPLFSSPYYATGYPITDAYWTLVQVGGVSRDVLVQCFERRCLTWNPLNATEWQVEAGNIGRHYYEWRYEQIGKIPTEAVIRTGDVQIVAILANPATEPGATHEYVDLASHAESAVQMEGWALRDESGTTYTFPSFKLPAGATVRIHVAKGIDSTADLYWGRTGSVWNNGSDTAYLYDPSGTLVSVFGY
jgi:hypothetical protein